MMQEGQEERDVDYENLEVVCKLFDSGFSHRL